MTTYLGVDRLDLTGGPYELFKRPKPYKYLTYMRSLFSRTNIIIVIVLILLVGGYYVTNNNKKSSSSNTTPNSQVNLNDQSGKTSSTSSSNSSSENSKVTSASIVSTNPAANAELTTKPTEVSMKVDKPLAAGSEIKVSSDKNVDVVTSGNKLSADLLTLTAPVSITVAGTYIVNYTLNWAVGGTTTGSYKFTVK